jgi:MOSC domain-containing protein YiiM
LFAHRRARPTLGGVIIEAIFTSPGHNYFGHHGQPAGDFPFIAPEKIECIAGRGIKGDRFLDYRNDYKGQVTFFARETFDALEMEFSLTSKSPGVLRRNLVVSGTDLNTLIGRKFSIQGVPFRGHSHCKPCSWMDEAFAPGTEQFLAQRRGGGLRAQILRDGAISLGEAHFVLQSAENSLAGVEA